MKLFFKQNIDYQKGTDKGNCVLACNSSKVVFQKETETDFFSNSNNSSYSFCSTGKLIKKMRSRIRFTTNFKQ